ncbi:hypothetical protein DI243_05040 [Paenibacillus polymyxa]|nr:hypothetical protein DI243_05040 [Paenibacillus polymyxa]
MRKFWFWADCLNREMSCC